MWNMFKGYGLAVTIALLGVLAGSCSEERKPSSTDPANWASKKSETAPGTAIHEGWLYLPVYSHIYAGSQKSTHQLTATVSIRNTSMEEAVTVFSATYYDTYGAKVRDYLPHPIKLAPLETVEIVVDQSDESGGSGANFIFHWGGTWKGSQPLIESVMISTASAQGISFTSRAVEMSRIEATNCILDTVDSQ